MSLMNKLLNPGPAVYYEEAFRAVFEDHLNFILNTKRESLAIESIDENKIKFTIRIGKKEFFIGLEIKFNFDHV